MSSPAFGWFQLSPPLVLRSTPAPGIVSPPPLCDSPVPAQTTRELLGLTASAPSDSDGSSCQSGNHDSAPSTTCTRRRPRGPRT